MRRRPNELLAWVFGLGLVPVLTACSGPLQNGPGSPTLAPGTTPGAGESASGASQSVAASTSATPPLPTVTPPELAPTSRAPLPSRFPVPADAHPAVLPADLAVLGRWTRDGDPPRTYDFYREELPKAGYRIVGLFPGGAVAGIRFEVGSGVYLRLDISGTSPHEIVLALDRA